MATMSWMIAELPDAMGFWDRDIKGFTHQITLFPTPAMEDKNH